MKLTDKQRKGIWIVGALLVVLHFAAGFVRSSSQAPKQVKPSAARPIDVPAPLPPVHFVDPQFAMLSGSWTGRYLRASYFCNTKLELRPNVMAADEFTAYTTMSCGPTDVNVLAKNGPPGNWVESFIKASTPVSAIFAGKIEGPSIVVHLTQAIGTEQNGCQPTSYTLTPFGDSQLAAKWDGAPCDEGQMVMTRAAK